MSCIACKTKVKSMKWGKNALKYDLFSTISYSVYKIPNLSKCEIREINLNFNMIDTLKT